jgi:hypothetical protein
MLSVFPLFSKIDISLLLLLNRPGGRRSAVGQIKRGSPRTEKAALIFNVPTLGRTFGWTWRGTNISLLDFEIVEEGDFESTTSLCNIGGSLSKMYQLSLGHCEFSATFPVHQERGRPSASHGLCFAEHYVS